MERTDYISLSPHMPDCVTAKGPRDCGMAGRRWKRSKLEKIKWRRGRGEGFARETGRVAEREWTRWRGAGGRGRQAEERFIKGKGKMMWRAYEVGPLSS